MGSPPEYVLGSAAAEVQRLDAQAAMYAAPTLLLLRAAGVEPGMRVLDLGTGLGHVAFAPAERVDAVIGRLLLFHLPDRVEVLRRHRRSSLRPGGRLVALDFDIGTARSEPPGELVRRACGWVESAFRAAQADPRVGARLGVDLSAVDTLAARLAAEVAATDAVVIPPGLVAAWGRAYGEG